MADLYAKLGEKTFDNLINSIYPPAEVFHIQLRKLSTAATIKRGSVLALSSRDGKFVILGTDAQAAVQAADAVYEITADVAIAAGKTYYTRSGSPGSYVYTAVASPVVENIATYYEMTTPAVLAQDAEVLTPNCILADDTPVGTTDDVIAGAYRTGHFNRNKIIVKTGYTFTAADEEALRSKGILLSDALN